MQHNSDMELLVKIINEWRKTKRSANEPMPESLWNRAVEVAVARGVTQVAAETGLAFDRLKTRVKAFQDAEKERAKANPVKLGVEEVVDLTHEQPVTLYPNHAPVVVEAKEGSRGAQAPAPTTTPTMPAPTIAHAAPATHLSTLEIGGITVTFDANSSAHRAAIAKLLTTL